MNPVREYIHWSWVMLKIENLERQIRVRMQDVRIGDADKMAYDECVFLRSLHKEVLELIEKMATSN